MVLQEGTEIQVPVSEREESVIVSNEDTPEDTEIPVSEREESVIGYDKDTNMPVVEAEHAVNVNNEDTSDIESNVTGNI